MRPTALDDSLDKGDFVVLPIPRTVLVHRHHGDEPAILDERAADDCLDTDRLEHLASLTGCELAQDVADHERASRPHVGCCTRPEQVEAVGAG